MSAFRQRSFYKRYIIKSTIHWLSIALAKAYSF